MKQLINEDIVYIGADDPNLDLFESQYTVPNGVAYNSYVVKGKDKTVIMDTIDARKTGEWLAKMERHWMAGRRITWLFPTSSPTMRRTSVCWQRSIRT